MYADGGRQKKNTPLSRRYVATQPLCMPVACWQCLFLFFFFLSSEDGNVPLTPVSPQAVVQVWPAQGVSGEREAEPDGSRAGPSAPLFWGALAPPHLHPPQLGPHCCPCSPVELQPELLKVLLSLRAAAEASCFLRQAPWRWSGFLGKSFVSSL